MADIWKYKQEGVKSNSKEIWLEAAIVLDMNFNKQFLSLVNSTDIHVSNKTVQHRTCFYSLREGGHYVLAAVYPVAYLSCCEDAVKHVIPASGNMAFNFTMLS